MEGSKVLSVAQYWAIACAASCTVNAFGLLGAVVPVSTAVSNRLQEMIQLGSSSDGRDSPQISLTTSGFLYQLSIEGEHTAMVCDVSPKLCTGCLRVAAINGLTKKTIAGRFLRENCALATVLKAGTEIVLLTSIA